MILLGAVGAIAVLLVPPGPWRRMVVPLRGMTRGSAARAARTDLPLLADLVALGVGAGLSFRTAVVEAAEVVDPSLRDEVLRSVRGREPEGHTVARLFSIARRAAESGASIAAEASGYAEELRAQSREEALTHMRRLPVRLLFPLALLILPGFLLMTLGPTLTAGIQRLGI